MFELTKRRIKAIFDHWDKGEKLCGLCENDWKQLTTAQRREYHNTYEAEKDE